MTKKLFCILAVFAVLMLGLVGALAVVPHVHGEDFHHSQHESCPIHQLGLSHTDAMACVVVIFIFIALFSWLTLSEHLSPSTRTFYFASLRAPPATS